MQIDIVIETDIHEWQSDKDYHYLNSDISEKHCKEFNEYNGNYPIGKDLRWENNEILKNRLHKTLDKYKHLTKVIVVCHGMLIHSVFQDCWAENGGIFEFNYGGT